jgi:GTP-binding protein
MFVDRVKVKVKAGKGGAGCVSFHREKFVPRGGPDGGAGGKGGDVIFAVEAGETTLVKLHNRPAYHAENGGPGSTNNKTGKAGSDIRLSVPPGTIVREDETGRFVCELVEDDSEAVVAAGGKGGKGNSSFATPTHQVPRRADPGQPGEEKILLVELKIVADVGLVGFPNAGKSTLLNALTSARAKIGSYPFTTLNPVIGTLRLDPHEIVALLQVEGKSPTNSRPPRVVIADIPGILEGAHEGVGLGLDFLRHIERTRVLLFVLDVSIHREYEPVEAYRALLSEIESYRADLLERPRLVALNKIDDPLDESEILSIRTQMEERVLNETSPPEPVPLFPISALKGEGLEPLRRAVFDHVKNSRQGAEDINLR